MEINRKSVKNILKEFELKLSGLYSGQEIRQITYMLFEEYLEWQRTDVQFMYDLEIPEPKLTLFTSALTGLKSGKPIQYITGKTWFNGILLRVNPNVLIPRPETGELCEIIGTTLGANLEQDLSVIDIGTGSGCIAIDLKKRFPDAHVTGIDSSQGALDMAMKNADENNCKIEFLRCDILKSEDQLNLGMFRMVVSNPPYVTLAEKKLMKPHVTEYEPSQALFVPDDAPFIFYHAICTFACSHLIRHGNIFFEINERFGAEIALVVRSYGFSDVKILKDMHGKERFIRAVLNSNLL